MKTTSIILIALFLLLTAATSDRKTSATIAAPSKEWEEIKRTENCVYWKLQQGTGYEGQIVACECVGTSANCSIGK